MDAFAYSCQHVEKRPGPICPPLSWPKSQAHLVGTCLKRRVSMWPHDCVSHLADTQHEVIYIYIPNSSMRFVLLKSAWDESNMVSLQELWWEPGSQDSIELVATLVSLPWHLLEKTPLLCYVETLGDGSPPKSINGWNADHVTEHLWIQK